MHTKQRVNLNKPLSNYSLPEDYRRLKEQIKEWEVSQDWVIECLYNIYNITGDIEVNQKENGGFLTIIDLINEVKNTSNEMMEINM